MQQQGFDILAVSADGPEVASLQKAGIPYKQVPFTRSITPFRDLHCLWRLIRIINFFKPDIVHTHTPKAGLLGMLAAWWCRVPVRLHTVAGLPLMEAWGLKRWLLKLTERITYACASGVYPNSKGLLSYIVNTFKIQNSKFKIIGWGSSNGIDLECFSITKELQLRAASIRSQFNIQSDEFLFCFVGRMVRDKGLVELISAFLKIHDSGKKVRLLLVGHFEDGLDPLPTSIRKKIENHSKIIHVGFQSDIRSYVLASDALVLPSYREGFPNVLLQAGALEKPCIATDINGCNEIIMDGKTGFLVPPKDTKALIDVMKKIISNKEWSKQAGREARQFIAQHFDQQYVWNEILKEYRYHLDRVSKSR